MHFPIEKIKSDEKNFPRKTQEGVVIERKDFENIEMNAGVFSWKNEHAFLYINEPYADEFDLKESPSENGPKYHLLNVKQLKKCIKTEDLKDMF